MKYSSAAASVQSSSQSKLAYRAIAFAGLIAGSLDLGTAFVEAGLEGRTPIHLLQGIAGGLLGMKTFQGGLASAALGAFFHFLIAFTAAAVFYVASRKLSFLVERAVLSGVLYGIAVWCFMSFAVLPLSAYHMTITIPPIGPVIKGIVVHIFMVGLPISLVVRKVSS
jgi:uncharacterized membrane protein YagU involved in acid resistance